MKKILFCLLLASAATIALASSTNESTVSKLDCCETKQVCCPNGKCCLDTKLSNFIVDRNYDLRAAPPIAKPDPFPIVSLSKNMETAVTLHTDEGRFCSGSIIKTKSGRTFILTVAHLPIHAIIPVTNKADIGKPKRFKLIKVTQEVRDSDNRLINVIETTAEVIRYSGQGQQGLDLCILRVANDKLFKTGIVFAGDRDATLGSELYMVSTPFDPDSLSNCVLWGRVSKINASPIEVSRYARDVADMSAIGGSSGGGIFLASTGGFVGFITNGAKDNLNIYLPVREMRPFAKRAGVEFLFDSRLPEVSDSDLKKAAPDFSDQYEPPPVELSESPPPAVDLQKILNILRLR